MSRRRPRPSARFARRSSDTLGLDEVSIDGDLLQRLRRPLAPDGAVLRQGPPARAVAAGRDARRLRQPDRSPARRARSTPRGPPRSSRRKRFRSIVRQTSPITPAARRRWRFTWRSARYRSPLHWRPSTGSTTRSIRPLELYGRALVVAVVWFFGHNGLAVAAKVAAHRPRSRRSRSRSGASPISASGRPS